MGHDHRNFYSGVNDLTYRNRTGPLQIMKSRFTIGSIEYTALIYLIV